METKHRGVGISLTFVTRFFTSGRTLEPVQIYNTKSSKTFVEAHHIICTWIWSPKKIVIAPLIIPTFFVVACQMWSNQIALLSCTFLVANNFVCIESMCVFISMTPLHFVVFCKPFPNNKTTFGYNIPTCLFKLVDNVSQDLNGFTMSINWLSLTTKKPQ
jgi:hypothetical protein